MADAGRCARQAADRPGCARSAVQRCRECLRISGKFPGRGRSPLYVSAAAVCALGLGFIPASAVKERPDGVRLAERGAGEHSTGVAAHRRVGQRQAARPAAATARFRAVGDRGERALRLGPGLGRRLERSAEVPHEVRVRARGPATAGVSTTTGHAPGLAGASGGRAAALARAPAGADVLAAMLAALCLAGARRCRAQ